MKILKELILNGEYIASDIPEMSNVKFKLDYDLDNNSFKITINQIDLTKSPSLNERKKALTKLAEIISEETRSSVSIYSNSLKLEALSLVINHHGVSWLSTNEDLRETIELFKLILKLQKTKNLLDKILPDIKKFIFDQTNYSTRILDAESQQNEYRILSKIHSNIQIRLLSVYNERLNELVRSKFKFNDNETTGITLSINTPAIFISEAAKIKLQAILDPQIITFAAANQSQNSVVTSLALFSHQNNNAGVASSPAPSLPSSPKPKDSPAKQTNKNLEPITPLNKQNIEIDLDLLFSTGELLITFEGNNYIASYTYELDLGQITIHVNKENQSNTVKDELSPRSLNCQQLVEIIHDEIIHKYPSPVDTKIILNKSDCTMVIPKQVVEKILVNQDSESSSRIIKTMNNLNKPDTIESNNSLLEITSNKHQYFRCMVVGDKYEITCESGNTQFKKNPGITQRMSSQLSWLVLNNFNSLVSDKYPDLHNNVDMRSLICEKPLANGFTFMINKKACDDVLITAYLKSSPELPMVTPQVDLTLESAKSQLNSFLAPFKDRYLSSVNLTDIKARISNLVRCLVTWMSETDLDMTCQFYEYLKTPDIFKYINAHKNPIYDSIFSKNNTDTWQKTMKLLKDYALGILKAKAAELEGSPNDKAALLLKYRDLPIFTDHRFNRFSNKFHRTHAVNEIDKLISSYQSQQNKVK